MIVIVMNDRGYGVIRHIQGALQDGRMFFDDLAGPDFCKLAELAGLPSFKVSSVEDLAPAVAQARGIRGPALIEVNMTAIGPFPPFAPYRDMGVTRISRPSRPAPPNRARADYEARATVRPCIPCWSIRLWTRPDAFASSTKPRRNEAAAWLARGTPTAC